LLRQRFFTSLIILCTTVGLARAQEVPLHPSSAPPDHGIEASVPAASFEPAAPPSMSAWFNAEYLLWWMRSAPTEGPLITSGDPADPVPGGLGQPGTQPFHDNGPLTLGNTSGLRLSAGVSFGDTLAVEGSYFVLEQRSHGFAAFSTSDGAAVIARPVFNDLTLTEGAYPIAFPGALSGGTAVTVQTQLHGFDVNLAVNLYRNGQLFFDMLGGFRSLYLNESLTISDSLLPVVPGFLTFKGAALDAFTPVNDFDSFRAQNTFYGGQLAGRLTWLEERFSASALGGLAVGTTQQVVVVNGATVVSPPGGTPVAAIGGILAQPSNIGRWSHSTFSLAPEAGLEVAYQVTRWLRASIGYTLVYWTKVARPGNQIDRAASPAQVPLDPGFGLGTGSARPAPPSFRESDFWAQGISFGLAFTY
jgi:hypothetical protein